MEAVQSNKCSQIKIHQVNNSRYFEMTRELQGYFRSDNCLLYSLLSPSWFAFLNHYSFSQLLFCLCLHIIAIYSYNILKYKIICTHQVARAKELVISFRQMTFRRDIVLAYTGRIWVTSVKMCPCYRDRLLLHVSHAFS